MFTNIYSDPLFLIYLILKCQRNISHLLDDTSFLLTIWMEIEWIKMCEINILLFDLSQYCYLTCIVCVGQSKCATVIKQANSFIKQKL